MGGLKLGRIVVERAPATGEQVRFAGRAYRGAQRVHGAVAMNPAGDVAAGEGVGLPGAQVAGFGLAGSQCHLGCEFGPEQGGQVAVLVLLMLAGDAGEFGVTGGDDVLRAEHGHVVVPALEAQRERTEQHGFHRGVSPFAVADDQPVGVAGDDLRPAERFDSFREVAPGP